MYCKSWRWVTKEEEAIEKLLTNAPVMAYFAKDAKTHPVTDTSSVGLEAVLRTTKRGLFIEASVLCQSQAK